jgi:hypothetical protein
LFFTFPIQYFFFFPAFSNGFFSPTPHKPETEEDPCGT